MSSSQASYRQFLLKVKERLANVQAGKLNYIPFPFPGLNQYLPGIIPYIHYGLTGGPNSAKSMLARSLFTIHPYQFCIDNPQFGLSVDIFFFALEDNAQKVVNYFTCHFLNILEGIQVTPLQLEGFDALKPLTKDIVDRMIRIEPIMDQFLSRVHIHDGTRNPYGIFETVRDYLNQPHIGTTIYEPIFNTDGTPVNDPKSGVQLQRPIRYDKKDPLHQVIVIVDNLSNLEGTKSVEGERALTEKETIDRWAKNYARRWLTEFFGCSVLSIQQQALDVEKKQFTSSGASIVEKLIPSMSTLGEARTTARTFHVLFGLFAPGDHGIEEFKGYNIKEIRDHFRWLNMPKSNISEKVDMALYFDGLLQTFAQLPNPKDASGLLRLSKHLERLHLERQPFTGASPANPSTLF